MSIEFYADLCSNHNQDIERALALIKTAHEIGCDGVKFQYFKADKLWDKDKFPTEYRDAKQNELQPDWIPSLAAAVHNKNMLFGLSIFDPKDIILKQYVDYFKIASFEAGWFDLVKACYSANKRLMISAGQINKDQLYNVLKNLSIPMDEFYTKEDEHDDQQIDILHCVSKYPAKLEDCNLDIIRDVPVINGWSDHTTSPVIIYSAVALGAQVIEFHLDLDDLKGPEWRHSWWPDKITRVIFQARQYAKSVRNKNWDEFYKNQDLKYKANPMTGKRGG